MIRRPPRSTQSRSSAASDVYKRQELALSPVISSVPLPLRFCRSSCASCRIITGSYSALSRYCLRCFCPTESSLCSQGKTKKRLGESLESFGFPKGRRKVRQNRENDIKTGQRCKELLRPCSCPEPFV